MKSILIVAAMAALVSCKSAQTTGTESGNSNKMNQGADNELTSAEKKDGWMLLFDGKSTTGWHSFNKKTDGSAWQAVNGTLHLDPKEIKNGRVVGGGDLMNENEFENFHLKLEWKVDSGANSGIIVYSKEDPKYEYSWHTGPEIQVLDNQRHPDAKIIKHRAGDLYDLVSSAPETVKPALEWNVVEIKSNKGHLEEWLNGTKVLDVTMWDDNWNKMVAGSKFRSRADFAKFNKGQIGVQDHGNKVWFRNIKIKKL